MDEGRAGSRFGGGWCREMLFGVGLATAVLAYSAFRFPESARGSGAYALAEVLATLLIYGAVSEWARRVSSAGTHSALSTGAKAGLVLGLIQVVNHSLEDFGGLRSPWPAILGVSMWALLFLCFGAVSSATYSRVDSFGLSVLASVWCGMVSTTMIVVFASILTLLSLPHMEVILAGDFLASGMTDSRAFVIRNLLEAASSHLMIVPCVAAAVATFSAVLTSLLDRVSRRVLLPLCFAGLVLLTASIASIRYASSLDRPARPPFVMFGLLALGVSLASAFPVASAIRKDRSKSPPTNGGVRDLSRGADLNLNRGENVRSGGAGGESRDYPGR